MLLTPAIGAPDFTKGRAKRIFYTKAQADARYVNTDEVGAGPVAYAHVDFNGNMIAGDSRNVTAVTKGSTGYYCVDVAVPYKNVQVTLDTTGSYTVAASDGDPFTSCGTFPSDIAVLVGGPTDSGFWILFT